MKQFKITRNNKDYIIKAANNVEAVKKLRDHKLKDAKRYEKKGLAEFTINDTHKAYCIGTMDGFNEKWNEAGLRQHAKKALESADYIRTLESKGYREDMQKAYLNDSKLKDYKYVDDRAIQKFAEYGGSISRELPISCYWEAVEELAGKLKTKQEYIREIPKLAKQKLEDYLKQIKVEFDKLINEAKSQSSTFSSWAPEQAEAILKKQSNKDSASVKDYNWETTPIPKAGATFPFKSKMSRSQFDNYVKDLNNRYPKTLYKTYNETEMGLDIILVYAIGDNRHVATYVPSKQMLYTEIRV